MQENKTTNNQDFTDISDVPTKGRLMALDLGTKNVGLAVSDEIQFTVRGVVTIKRKGWKKFRNEIIAFIEEFDAKALVLGLPYNFDGSESAMSREARNVASKFSKSLNIPVYLHDERVTTYEARGKLWELGYSNKKVREKLDSEAAAIILDDLIETRNQMLKNQ